uniref:Uncharacterized protein n=1 Tax=Rhizophora mucronata TaxID=61149 RepID=A0A2P2PFS3_RHIMU
MGRVLIDTTGLLCRMVFSMKPSLLIQEKLIGFMCTMLALQLV